MYYNNNNPSQMPKKYQPANQNSSRNQYPPQLYASHHSHSHSHSNSYSAHNYSYQRQEMSYRDEQQQLSFSQYDSKYNYNPSPNSNPQSYNNKNNKNPNQAVNSNNKNNISNYSLRSNNMSNISNWQSPVNLTDYMPLTNQDLLYYGNLHQCKNQEFRIVIRKIVKDLALLLQFRYDDFWAELRSSAELKKLMQSCLQILPRRSFSYYQQKPPNNSNLSSIPSSTSPIPHSQSPNPSFNPSFNPHTHSQIILPSAQSFTLFTHLFRLVLFLYYRIICQSKPAQKQLIYQQWLLDIPKIMNLISIYQGNNQRILRNIVDTALSSIKQYRNDVIDFCQIFACKIIPALFLDFKFEYTQKLIANCKNFNNPMLSFTRNLLKSFFRAFDTFTTLTNFLQYFPLPYSLLLISNPCIILQLFQSYFMYMHNITGRWQFPQLLLQFLLPVLNKTRQVMVGFFIQVLEMLREVLLNKDNNSNTYNSNNNSNNNNNSKNYEDVNSDIWDGCLEVYYGICKQFNCRNQVPNMREFWEELVNVIIKELCIGYNVNNNSKDRNTMNNNNKNIGKRLFFVTKDGFRGKLKPQQIYVIKQCMHYQDEYLKQLNNKNFNNQQILQLKLSAIKSYKQWKDFQNFKSFDLMVQDHYAQDSTIQQDSILYLLSSQMHKSQHRHRKKPTNPSPLYSHLEYQNFKYKRVNKYPYFSNQEYNDQPVYHEEEGVEGMEEGGSERFGYPFGMEKLEDLPSKYQGEQGEGGYDPTQYSTSPPSSQYNHDHDDNLDIQSRHAPNNTKFKKFKLKQQNYSQYYNQTDNNNKQKAKNQNQSNNPKNNDNSNNNKNISSKISSINGKSSVTKKTYIAYDQLSIKYQNSQQNENKIQIQKVQRQSNSGAFKKQANPLSSSAQKQQNSKSNSKNNKNSNNNNNMNMDDCLADNQQISSLSIGNQDQSATVQDQQLMNLMKAINQSELSVKYGQEYIMQKRKNKNKNKEQKVKKNKKDTEQNEVNENENDKSSKVENKIQQQTDQNLNNIKNLKQNNEFNGIFDDDCIDLSISMQTNENIENNKSSVKDIPQSQSKFTNIVSNTSVKIAENYPFTISNTDLSFNLHDNSYIIPHKNMQQQSESSQNSKNISQQKSNNSNNDNNKSYNNNSSNNNNNNNNNNSNKNNNSKNSKKSEQSRKQIKKQTNKQHKKLVYGESW